MSDEQPNAHVIGKVPQGRCGNPQDIGTLDFFAPKPLDTEYWQSVRQAVGSPVTIECSEPMAKGIMRLAAAATCIAILLQVAVAQKPRI